MPVSCSCPSALGQTEGKKSKPSSTCSNSCLKDLVNINENKWVKSTKIIKFIDWPVSLLHLLKSWHDDPQHSALLRHCGQWPQARQTLHSGDSISNCDWFWAHTFKLHLSVRLLLQFCCQDGLSNSVTPGKFSPKWCLDHHNLLLSWQSVAGCRYGLLEHSAKTHCPAPCPTHLLNSVTEIPKPSVNTDN